MNLAGLTPNQERYLLAESSAADSFFITVWYPCDQAPDPGRLQAALWAVIAEEPALRTGFARDPTHGYRSVVRPQAKPPLRRLDVDALDAPSIARAAAAHLAKLQDFSDPAALQHYFLARSTDESFALVFSQHHAISDGRSLDIFIERVAARYSGRPASTPAPPAELEQALVGEDACADYFRRQLQAESGFPTFHRDRDAAFEITARSLDLGPELSAALQQAAAATSPFSVLAAAFAAQVHAQTGAPDVLISIQSGGRSPATRHAIGSLSNAVAINVQVAPDEPFRRLTQRVRDLVRAAVRHEALPYHQVQAITGAKADFALNLYPDAPPPAFDGLRLGPRRFLPMPSDYGVNLRWQRRLGDQEAIYEGEAYFDGGSIDPARIDHFLSRHRDILAAAIADPDACVGDIVAASRRPPPDKTLPASLPTPRLFDLFRRAADQHPTRPALRYDGASITYGELGDRVERRAAALAQLGLAAGDRVAFIEQRSPDYVVTMLALSRLGATFAVFDPAYPFARLGEQAEAFRPDWILSGPGRHAAALDGLRQAGWRCAEIPASAGTPAPQPPAAAPTDIAYCLFTSGTTGRPSAVSVGHAALPAFLEWQGSTFGIGPEDRVSMLSGLSHDPIMRDIFLPLSCGATLLVPDEPTMHDARSLWAWLSAEAPTVIHATPPLGRLLCAITDGSPALPGLRYMFWGGDMLASDIVETFQVANPALQQVNFYGATETPQAVAYHLCGPDDRLRRVLPIGKATGPARISVIDAQQRRLATNEVGEVLVETPYFVAAGADVPAAGEDADGQRHRSGDRGYLLPDQSVMLVGRADDQVKIRGYRVELADVARHIRALDEVADAAVLVGAAPDGEPQLIAHVVPRDPAHPDIGAAVRQRTARSLPSYMTPAQVIAHARLPLLPNGKIDRAALRDNQAPREGSDPEGRQAARPFNVDERRIAGVFADLLGRPVDSPEQSFADLGADSLNSVHAMLRLEAMIPTLPDDWHALSIAELAALLPATARAPTNVAGDLFRTVRVDPAVVLRAAAIVLIVAFHYKLLSVGGGLTFALFMLAGVTFARFQLGGARETGSTRAIARGLIKVAIISFPIGLVMGLRRIQGDMSGGWRMIAFAADFIDFASFPAEQQLGVWLWFIGCYLQIMLAVLLLLRLPAVRRRLATHPLRTLLLAFLTMASLRFALPAALNPGGLGGIEAMSIWTFIPTAHAATFLLGALLESTRRGSPERWGVIALGAAYAVATGYYFPGNEPLLTTTAIVLVGLVVAFPMPRIAALVAVLVSHASLYIYLLHGPLHSVLTRLGLGSPAVSLLIAVPLIVAAAMVFDRLYDRVAGGLETRRSRSAAAAGRRSAY